MQQPIKLSVGYAYIMSGEALICTVEDGQPSHAFTLTVDDLRALLAAFGEDAPPPSVPLEVQQAIDSCLDILQTYHSGNPFLSDPVTSEMEIVRSWRNALSQPRDGETC